MDALEQSGNVRKACHSTWAGEGTVLSVAIGETSASEVNKEEGSVSSSFLLLCGSDSSPLWYADEVWKAAVHYRLWDIQSLGSPDDSRR